VILEGSAFSVEYRHIELDGRRDPGPRDPVILMGPVILDGTREEKTTQQKTKKIIALF